MSTVSFRSYQLSMQHRNKLAQRIRDYIDQSQAKNTRRGYKSDWDHFSHWCEAQSVQNLPCSPETVAYYISDLAEHGYKVSTLQRRLSSIAIAHKTAGYPSPTEDTGLRTVWRGIRKEHGTAQQGKKPLLTMDIKNMVHNLALDTLSGLRDRALILVGFAGGFRRSELVALDVADIQFAREGLVILIRRSKTDQTGEGRKVAIPYGSHLETCPVRALQDWLSASLITDGPLFRKVNKGDWVESRRLSDKSVANIVKRTIKSIGIDPTQYSGHSLRAGFATSSAAAGASERDIMRQTGHRSVVTVRRYIRDGEMFKANAAARLGL
ncbi:site-specific integrase [Alicyclobacillus fastidiosus]|uniref:site-specific integrase n=1 Tax=Alicyclobacillus fastidiosus TaxID=392011 RepID=UPI0023E95524|nr:site-specific integrase [Alicyclobacillus fastidiosus]GMA66071.1 integrase [Alicyclobacillus fastidiosus]